MSDRRTATRYSVTLPISVQEAALDAASSHAGRTLAISTSGVHLILDFAPNPGATLDFTITLPTTSPAGGQVLIHGIGKVLRVDAREHGRFEVAVVMEHYELSRDGELETFDPIANHAPEGKDATWCLSGTYFESCNCDVVCPCAFLSAPTTGECTSLVGWHIHKGSFADVFLDGLNVAVAVYSPGKMRQAKWKVAIYIDARATSAQTDALEMIFSGRAGGHPVSMAAQMGELLGVKSVPIEYHVHGKRHRLRIPRIAEAEIETISGQDGKSITVGNRPPCVAPGNFVELARSKHLSYADHGSMWDISDKSAFVSTFDYASQ